MRIYWYWPFARPEDLVLADAVPGPGDSIAVHAVAGRVDAGDRAGHLCDLMDTLPPVGRHRERTPAWAASRALTYLRRTRARTDLATSGAFDVAHVFYLNYFTDGLALRSLGKRIPLVSTVHDVVPHQSRMPRRAEKAMLAMQYRAAGTLIVHHEQVRDRLVEEFDVDPSRVVLIPHWVIPSQPRPRVRPGDPPTVLFFGTLRRNKGVAVLLDAIARMKERAEIRFVICGGGAQEIEEAVASAARDDRRIVAELGYATAQRKHALYESADLVVLPYTEFASQSGVLHDAYSRHVPVIVSEVGALGDTVRHDGTGWVVPPGDTAALSDTIAGALANRGALTAASEAAAAVAEARHPRVIGAAFRDVYARVMAGR